MERLTELMRDFLADCHVRQLSPNTVNYYRNALDKFIHFASSQDISGISQVQPALVRQYITSLEPELALGGIHARLRALRVFLSWLVDEEVIEKNPMRKVKLPKVPQERCSVVEFQEFKALLTVAEGTRKALRNQAIVMMLYDTGLRASELLDLELGHVEFGSGLWVEHGKGGKSRLVPLSRPVGRVMKRYLTVERPTTVLPNVFVSSEEAPLTRHGLRKMILELCRAANVAPKGPHAFRRGFAVQFIKNGGDVFTLRRILGHTTLTMSDRYAALGNEDIKEIHRRASPLRQS